MRVKKELDRAKLVAAAMGEIPCDLSVENVKLVNVITGEIYPASVDVLDGVIVRVRTNGCEAEKPSAQVYDGKGRYLAPGCIDIHMHVESTMMTPENFGRAAIRCGTTSVFVCMGKPVPVPGAPAGTRKKQLPLGVVMDERIATGIEYSRFFAAFERYLGRPELLETRLDGAREPVTAVCE